MIRRFADISRRDLLRIAGRFGWSSIFLAAATLVGTVDPERVAKAAGSEHKRRFAKKARVNLVYGTPINPKNFEHINPTGCIQFVRDIEERTDGEIRVELIDRNKVCDQLDCLKRTMDRTIDLSSSTTQNASAVASYYSVLDFPCLFPSRAAQHHFFYHPRSRRLFREPLRKNHGIIFLFTNCRLRGIFLGPGHRDKPDINRIDQLAGMKIRASGSRPVKLALRLLKMKPIPIPWEETPGALKHRMVDGMEAYETGASIMPEVISQEVDLRFLSGNRHTAMNEKAFGELAPCLQDAVMESAYQTQMFLQLASESLIFNAVGATSPQKPDTVFGLNRIRFVELPGEELEKAERMCSPEFNPNPWKESRAKLNKMAGNIDIYSEIYKIAREIPAGTPAEDIEPRRWWKKT